MHAKHGYWTHGYTAWNDCPGWSEQEAGTAALIEQLNQAGREAVWPRKMPEGIVLECHPVVRHFLHNAFIPGYTEFVSGTTDLLKPQIPVVVCVAMDRGAWCLRADSGVIAEGVIRDARQTAGAG